MTLFVPDVSHHQEDISIQGLIDSGAAALLARVGQGAGRRRNGATYDTTRDRKWQRNLAEANRLGLLIRPYWYVGNLISPDENARLAAEWVGDTSLPWMLDHEDASGDIAFYQAVLAAFGRRGLHVALGYVPHWYWNAVGGGSLAGPPLVNSAYPGGSGAAAQIYGDGSRHAGNFADYGGNSVALLQFTNQARMADQLVDCSAFKGTTTQLAALLGGQEIDMNTAQDAALSELWLTVVDGSKKDAQLNRDLASVVSQVGTRVDVIAAQIAALAGALSDDEANIIAAVRALPAGAPVDVPALASALGPFLSPLINAGATPAQVEDAVRRVFASAGQAGGSPA